MNNTSMAAQAQSVEQIAQAAKHAFTQVPQATDILQGYATLPRRLAALLAEQCSDVAPPIDAASATNPPAGASSNGGRFALESLGLGAPPLSLSACKAQGKPYVVPWRVRFSLWDAHDNLIHAAETDNFCALPLMVGTPGLCTADPALVMANGGGGFFVCAKGIERAILPQRTLIQSMAHVRENGSATDLILEFRAAAGERSTATTFLKARRVASHMQDMEAACGAPDVVPTTWLKFAGKQFTLPAQWLLALLGFRGRGELEALMAMAGVTKLPIGGDVRTERALAERQARWATWCATFCVTQEGAIAAEMAKPDHARGDIARACILAHGGWSASAAEPSELVLTEGVSRLRYLMLSELFPHVTRAGGGNVAKAILLVQCVAHLAAVALGLRPTDNRDSAVFCGFVELPHVMVLFFMRSLLSKYMREEVKPTAFAALRKLHALGEADVAAGQERHAGTASAPMRKAILAMLTGHVFGQASQGFTDKFMSAMGKRLRPGTRGTGKNAERAANSSVTQAPLPPIGGAQSRTAVTAKMAVSGAHKRIGREPRGCRPDSINLICPFTTGSGQMTGLTPQKALGAHYCLGSPLVRLIMHLCCASWIFCIAKLRSHCHIRVRASAAFASHALSSCTLRNAVCILISEA
jgi:hypothetical protein